MLTGSERCDHCGAATVPPEQLARPVVTGVTAVAKAPATGVRDAIALLGTGLGFFVATGLGFLALGPIGALAGPAVAAFGYNKQFWRVVLARRHRVLPIASPEPPRGAPIRGIVRPHERTLDSALGALVVSTTFAVPSGVIVRTIEAVPFWLVLADTRRIFVDGTLWLAAAAHEPAPSAAHDQVSTWRLRLKRSDRKRLTVARTILCDGDTVAAHGSIAPELLASAGYRGQLVDAMRGQPGAPVWLERVDA